MDLSCQLLLYLDKKHVLKEMKNACERFLEDGKRQAALKFPPCRFLLEVDVMDLLNFSHDVGELLLREPFKWQKMCSDTLFACLQLVNDATDEEFQLDQAVVNLRPKCIPKLLVHRTSKHHNGLNCYQGILLSVSKPSSYVYHTVWSCPEQCEGSEVILHYIPKVPPKCYVCRTVLFENSGLRRCGDQVTATFKLIDDMLPKNFNIVDDLLPRLTLGAHYDVFTVSVKKSTIVWALEEVFPLAAPLTAPIPPDIADLFKACKGVPWQFIYCLASGIGVNICPLQCFMHVKICMLLSLVSVRANAVTGSPIIHVLVAGYDTGYAGRLFEEGAKLAGTSVCLGTSNTSAATALIGSSGGVCVLPLPLHIYNQKQTSFILSSIETGEFATDEGRTKLQSAVWAQGMDFKKMILLNVASVFGTVCRGDYGTYNDDIVDFVLQNAIEPPKTTKEEIRALKDIEKYIDLVSGIEVTLDAQAEALIRDYFLAARRERPKGVSVGSMASLVATTVTSARLCRRCTTSTEDAVLAIWLHVCGSPEPRFAPEEYLQTPASVKELQTIIKNFKDWLEQFTGNFIS